MGRGDPAAEEEWGDLPIVDMEVFSRKKGMEFPKNVYTKWFDCDKIKGTPVVRTRRPGILSSCRTITTRRLIVL